MRCTIPALVYADDFALFADTPEELQKLLEICSTEMTRIGLQFNQTKSMVMAWGAEQPEASWILQGARSS